MAVTEKFAVTAVDCVNGTTYIGLHPMGSFGRSVAELELIDYVVVSTRKLTEVDIPYK
tara:strand:- start:725 stop:898 length:174 start_codon:yes stop_codon:yes gene_type:complete